MAPSPATIAVSRMSRNTARKTRADLLMVERGLAETRERAQAMIMAGMVFAPTGRVAKSGALLPSDSELDVRGRLPYVGRGGFKMAHALDTFGVEVKGAVALDVGASTGGFTDCLLQRGASRVYALDVGHGQLAYSLRQDSRVVCMEKVNARLPFELPEMVDMLVIDVSFISLTLALPQPLGHLRPGGQAIALVKPQFEARRGEVGRGGVIRNQELREDILCRVEEWLRARDDVTLLDTINSPIAGDAGNLEYLALLRKR